jgi:hypothetical protein
MIDLTKLANKLDEALIKETTEKLTKFLNDKRMKNKQTNNKLYTEEEILNYLTNHKSTITRYDLQNIPHIELPSKEELSKEFDIDKFDPYDLAYLSGAIRMRNLIQGGSK